MCQASLVHMLLWVAWFLPHRLVCDPASSSAGTNPAPPPPRLPTPCFPQSMDQVAALFEADDPLLAECGAKVMARAGRLMLEACRTAKKEVPAEVGASQDLVLCRQLH